MKLVDANVLLYAVNTTEPRSDEAAGWLDSALSGHETVGFCWTVLLAFLRLVTRPGLFPRPLTVDEAIRGVEAWTSAPRS